MSIIINYTVCEREVRCSVSIGVSRRYLFETLSERVPKFSKDF